jgi:predicted DNA-binding protein (UPF0251 family)
MTYLRKVDDVRKFPAFNGFRPLGVQSNRRADDIVISYREYEVLALCESAHFSEKEAARTLNISEKYLRRIHRSVMNKIAKAFIGGHEIYFGENNINVANWYECRSCGITFTITSSSGAVCPFCHIALQKLN